MFLASVAVEEAVDDSLSNSQVEVYVAMNVTKTTFPDEREKQNSLLKG
jgi:hypothetical protein